MSAQVHTGSSAAACLLEVRGLGVDTPGGRPLFRELSIRLGRERVALFGRNGVGKSTLLELLAGHSEPAAGSVLVRTEPVLVRQDPSAVEALELLRRWQHRATEEPGFAGAMARQLDEAGLAPLAQLAEAAMLSRGEVRKLHLLAARRRRPDLLLLDEPTRDLDEAGIRWLLGWVRTWPRGLLVVSHERRLLRCFEHFVRVAESGCRYFPGPFEDLERRLEAEAAERQRRYVENLSTLEQKERHHLTVNQRRRRKKNVGRLHELDRCTPRSRLNKKRSYAQQSQGRVAKIRADRIGAVRDWAKAARRALRVNLPLEALAPTLREPDGRDVIRLAEVGVTIDGKRLFDGITTGISRHRLAVLGPNGAGKTTLLRVMLGQQRPTEGTATRRLDRIGSIAQGGADWMRDDSLVSLLLETSELPSLDVLAQTLMAHRFPLALAQRPLRSLSPGERVRAALIALFTRTPAVEVLVLDEPTYSLDFVGAAALRSVLRAWPGGLVVASHDREFLAEIGVDRQLTLDGRGGHRLEGNADGAGLMMVSGREHGEPGPARAAQQESAEES